VGLALSLAGVVQAQGFRVSGTVVHVSAADTTPVPERWVVLHGITVSAGAPLDSVRSNDRGGFTFRAATFDSLTSYLVSVEYQGIGYFSEPFAPGSGAAERLPPLAVYDTSSLGPPIQLAERHVFVRRREPDGSRRVVELFVFANRGTETRIALDWSRPVWTGRIPAEAREFEVGLSDMSDEAIRLIGDTVAVAAPIPPGEREMLVGYLLPADVRELHVPIDQFVETFALLLEDSTASVVDDALPFVGVGELEEGVIRRFGADSLDAGTALTVRFARPPFQPSRLLWLLVPLTVGAFALGLWRWTRLQRAAGSAEAVEADDATVLAAQIAALDAEFSGRETDAYRRRRAELKARLAQVLKGAG
jgi:hypothetical protein